MRGRKRERGKWNWTKGLLVPAALFGVVLIVYPDAFADDPQIEELVELIETQPARHRRLMALKELCDLDTAAAREAVIDLAESDDDQIALAAITALSREDFRGARDALEDIVDDTGRSDFIREAALGACLHHRKSDARSWSSQRTWVRNRTENEERLEEFAKAYAAKRWGSEVDDE